jgi:hypothetical protein
MIEMWEGLISGLKPTELVDKQSETNMDFNGK